MKHCANCQIEYNNDVAFCSRCGNRLIEGNLQYSCPNCGKILGSSYESFCPHCGYQLRTSQNSVDSNTKASAKKYIVIASVVAILVGGYFGFKQNLINADIISPTSGDEYYEYAMHILGKENNLEKASKWFILAAEKGNSKAKRAYGGMLCYGLTVDKDVDKGLKLLHEGAEEGVKEAQHDLYHFYRYGFETVKKDYKKAFTWAMMAAEQDDIYAMNSVGDCYRDGIGTEKNLAKAYKWYKKGADKGNKEAKISLINFMDANHKQFKDNKYYITLLEELVKENDPFGLFTLGRVYALGESDVQKDLSKGTDLLEKAAQNGSVRAYYVLGIAHHGTPKAFKYYKLGAEANDLPCMEQLAYCYLRGEGVEADVQLHDYWMNKYRKNGGKTFGTALRMSNAKN